MLSGATPRACAMAGTAVFRIVVSSDSMKNAMATSQGRRRLLASPDWEGGRWRGDGIWRRFFHRLLIIIVILILGDCIRFGFAICHTEWHGY